MKKKTIGIIGFSLLGLALVGVITWLAISVQNANQQIDSLNQTNAELIAQNEIVRENMAAELDQLSIEYEGYKLKVNNDSLYQKLEDQRIHIQQLQDQLKQTKSEDARTIAQLRKELKTVRETLKYYIAQVDSLSRVNETLIAENHQVRQQVSQMSNANASLQQENKNLAQKVDIASHLKAQGMKAIAQNKRSKETNSLDKTTTFQLTFSISPNVTAQPGEKDIYVRILKPDEDILTNERSGQFKYDGGMIQYSIKKTVEYSGEELPVTMYWNRKETLNPGTYTFEIYADGKLMGKCSLSMKK